MEVVIEGLQTLQSLQRSKNDWCEVVVEGFGEVFQ